MSRPQTDNESSWRFPLLRVTEDKRTRRTGVRPQPASEMQFAHELVGMDGSLEGGFRPFPGFQMVHTLNNGNLDNRRKVTDVFPVTFAVGDAGYAYGFVYRARQQADPTKADIYIDYWNSLYGSVTSVTTDDTDDAARWKYGTVILQNDEPDYDSDGFPKRQMDVAVFGRFVYVFLENRRPILFYLDKDGPWSDGVGGHTGENFVGKSGAPFPGPGIQPTLLSPDESGSLGGITGTGATNRPGAGQVVLTSFKPSEVGLGLGGSGSGPGDQDEEIRRLEPGDYAFAYLLYNSKTGRRSGLSEIAQCRWEDFVPYQSAASGGATSTSVAETDALTLYAAMEIVYDSSKYDQAYVYRSVKTQEAGGVFAAAHLFLDRIIDLSDFHTSNVGSPPYDGDIKQGVYWYEQEDKQLIFNSLYTDYSIFDEDMPAAGAAVMYEGTMVCGRVKAPQASTGEGNRINDALTGIGEIKYSSLREISPELFPPENRFVPEVPHNEVLRFQQVGNNVIGWSRDRQYLVRKQAGDLRIEEMHPGFGLIAQRAVDVVGSMAYFATTKGIKAVTAGGQLEDAKALNALLLDEWAGQLNHLSMAYDPTLNALFLQNPDLHECAVFWFNTGTVTELHDMNFTQCARGVWPVDFRLSTPGTYSNPLVERAFFFLDVQREDDSDLLVNATHRIYLTDYQRSKRQTQGEVTGPRTTLLDFSGDARFDTAIEIPPGTITDFDLQLSLDPDVSGGSNKVLVAAVQGAYMHVLESSNAAFVGQRARIKERKDSDEIVISKDDIANVRGLPAGSRIGISPIVCQWVGHNLPPQGGEHQYGTSFDYFRVRHVSSVGCAFSSVAGSPATDGQNDARFRALVYHGNTSTAEVTGETKDGAGAFIMSVDDEENSGTYFAAFPNSGGNLERPGGVIGADLVPGVRIVCPDLDFVLLEVMVVGKTTASFRAKNPTIGPT